MHTSGFYLSIAPEIPKRIRNDTYAQLLRRIDSLMLVRYSANRVASLICSSRTLLHLM